MMPMYNYDSVKYIMRYIMTWKLALERQNKLYYVSDVGGRVKAVSKKTGKEKELTYKVYNRYIRVSYGMLVHRLVAMAFVPNPENKQYVDHIDGNKLNNDASNLRWVNAAENSHNPITKQRQIQGQRNAWNDARREEWSRRMKAWWQSHKTKQL